MSGRGWRAVLLGAAAVAVAAWGVTAAFGEDDTTSWTEAAVRDLVVGVQAEGTLASRDSTIVTPPALSDVFEFSIAFMAPEGRTVAAGAGSRTQGWDCLCTGVRRRRILARPG